MSNEIKHIRRDTSYIKRKVGGIDELKAGQARLEGLMEEMKELVEGMSEHVKETERKTRKRGTVFGMPQSR